MSAALVILPMVWATESFETESFNTESFQTEPFEMEALNPDTLDPDSLDLATLTPEILDPILLEEFASEEADPEDQAAPEMAFYRKYTEAMLRRFATMEMEAGRVPALLGRELFRGKVTSCTMHSFDDVVIFVLDVTRCLRMLTEGQQYLIRRIALQEYTQVEISAMTGIALRTVHRRYAAALDRLTEIFFERKLLEPRTASHEAGSVKQ